MKRWVSYSSSVVTSASASSTNPCKNGNHTSEGRGGKGRRGESEAGEGEGGRTATT